MRIVFWIVLVLALFAVMASVAAIVAGKILSALDEVPPPEAPTQPQPFSIRRLFRWVANGAANVWEVLYLGFVMVWALSRKSPSGEERFNRQEASPADMSPEGPAVGPPAGHRSGTRLSRVRRRARRSTAASVSDKS
jgi:hypothetical protein